MGMLAKAGTYRQRAARAALAAATSAALALACALPAAADEAGEGDGFELNLSMEVSDVLDPDAPVHPVTVTVAGPDGEPVAGASVAYEFAGPNPLYYVPPDGSGEPGEYAADGRAQAGGMALAGEAVTDESGTARVEGIVRGCDYLVEATADGYEPYSSTHTCKGTGSEQWFIRLERASGEVVPPAGDGSGSGDAGGSGSGAGAGSGASWGGLFPWLSVTGDALLPWLLALSGAGLAALALTLLARRRKDDADA